MGVASDNFVEEGFGTLILCLGAPITGFIFSYIYFRHTARIILDPELIQDDENVGLKLNEDKNAEQTKRVWEVYNLIYEGAHSFLYAEYSYIAVFMAGFSIILLVVLGATNSWVDAVFTVIAFLVGAATSGLFIVLFVSIFIFIFALVSVLFLFFFYFVIHTKRHVP